MATVDFYMHAFHIYTAFLFHVFMEARFIIIMSVVYNDVRKGQ